MKTRLLGAVCACLFAFASGATLASPAKFDIPGDFPGTFQIDFLGTDFKLDGTSSGSLSTASIIQFSVGSETAPGSGIYNTSVSPQGFNFLGFQPVPGFDFDVYGAGTGAGTFDTNTGDWEIDMPALFVNESGSTTYGTRLDFRLTTQNIFIPGAGLNTGYTTTTATPMVIDELSPDPWGDLNLVGGGIVPNSSALTLAYDFGLISDIGNTYTNFTLDANIWEGVQYEFDIFGNDPLVETAVVPIPAAAWLFGSGLLGLVGMARRKKA